MGEHLFKANKQPKNLSLVGKKIPIFLLCSNKDISSFSVLTALPIFQTISVRDYLLLSFIWKLFATTTSKILCGSLQVCSDYLSCCTIFNHFGSLSSRPALFLRSINFPSWVTEALISHHRILRTCSAWEALCKVATLSNFTKLNSLGQVSAIVLPRPHHTRSISLPWVAVMAEGFFPYLLYTGKSPVCLPKKASPHGFEFSYFFSLCPWHTEKEGGMLVRIKYIISHHLMFVMMNHLVNKSCWVPPMYQKPFSEQGVLE